MEKRVPDDARDACLAAPYDAPDARPGANWDPWMLMLHPPT